MADPEDGWQSWIEMETIRGAPPVWPLTIVGLMIIAALVMIALLVRGS
jgi:hypothetical protein